MSNLTVALNPEQRTLYLAELLRLDGLEHITEDPKAAYSPLSLTSTPDELKPFIKKRQEQTVAILKDVGISSYDPASGAWHLNPDIDLTTFPQIVYGTDTQKILAARFFVGHLILPSTGFGNEGEKARIYNRMAVIFVDEHIRVSRMQPYRTIYLQYDNFEKQCDDFKKIFLLLQEYEPGMGFNGTTPILAGFHKQTKEVVDLEGLIYTKFPHLQYKYNGEVPILKLRAENPELFYEYE
ncbi:MAG: hypothetical protein A3A33_03825 [Candidatus Yanofskybacteria bacterium RIFCSPLOWO2_01_FULL_49_25]|uniref:Uncharacterized protein n=1 Tax=Candidatus Yanofskybacteria bacterium RIFCSPLOWO2_01_FULL_49_25 TaxID=1802701 RepID=A0A1F8GV73_9BACT|nr:MAG: hypothetical protein A3A33_03825 [Candidatus Yanofskybacteria bacterium RIFCSPLOWO2_01_FULL_49_25]